MLQTEIAKFHNRPLDYTYFCYPWGDEGSPLEDEDLEEVEALDEIEPEMIDDEDELEEVEVEVAEVEVVEEEPVDDEDEDAEEVEELEDVDDEDEDEGDKKKDSGWDYSQMIGIR